MKVGAIVKKIKIGAITKEFKMEAILKRLQNGAILKMISKCEAILHDVHRVDRTTQKTSRSAIVRSHLPQVPGIKSYKEPGCTKP